MSVDIEYKENQSANIADLMEICIDSAEQTSGFYNSVGLIRCTQLNTISYIKIY